MARRVTIREQLARAWYALAPATVDGQEISFEFAPPAYMAHVYARADQVIAMLASEQQAAA